MDAGIVVTSATVVIGLSSLLIREIVRTAQTMAALGRAFSSRARSDESMTDSPRL
jgi:hypothetical protein